MAPIKEQVHRVSKFAQMGMILLLASCANRFNPLPFSSSVQILAHRGGAGVKPENSLEAFKFSVAELGADAIELDVRQTGDSKLVINHDAKINPLACLTPGGGKILTPVLIYQTPLSQIQQYDCGTLAGLPPGTHLPSLDEVFQTIEKLRSPSNKPPRYLLHVKWEENTVDPNTYVSIILASLNTYDVFSRLSLMSDSETILIAAKQQQSQLSLTYLGSDTSVAIDLAVQSMAFAGEKIDQSVVNSLHAHNISVYAFTVNAPYQWISLVDIGVDGIVTDLPTALYELKKGDLSVLDPSYHLI